MSINPLICYLRPKDIPEVLTEMEKIPCDKLYINYICYPYPHRIARDYFLSHPEYTHLMIIPNDLVVTRKDYERMIDNISKYPMLDVLCGVCNVDLDQEKDYWAICHNLPDLGGMNYNWYKSSLRDVLQGRIIRVPFAGMPFMVMARHVIEGLTNELSRPGYDGTDLFGKEGYATDVYLCHNLWNFHIPIYCDTGIEMLHLRYKYEMQVGKKSPSCELHTQDKVLNVTDECYKLINVTQNEIRERCKSV